MADRTRHGPHLPYRLLAGVVPCPGGWLVASAKLQGITMSPETPQVMRTFTDVLDAKPAYDVITLAAPIGLPDTPTPRGRQCDREARTLLGWPRSGSILSPPARCALGTSSYGAAREANGGHLSAVTWLHLRHLTEIDKVIAPYWQRTVFEVHPELSFHQLNSDATLVHGKHTPEGQKERTTLLVARIPGVERILDEQLPRTTLAHRIDGAACLWTARRVAARAVMRLPEQPVWDSQGLRMELVR